MKYEVAVKKLGAEKPRENYMLIVLGYSNKIILPYKEGAAFMATLNMVEKYNDDYNKPKRIVEFERDTITCQIMPHQEYRRLKLAALLQITPEELLEYEKAEAEATPT